MSANKEITHFYCKKMHSAKKGRQGCYEYSVPGLTNISEVLAVDHFYPVLVPKMHFGHRTGGSRFYKE